MKKETWEGKKNSKAVYIIATCLKSAECPNVAMFKWNNL